MNTQIKAIIFDSDGTLLDTRQFVLQGYMKILKQHGLDDLADKGYITKRLGKPVVETYQQLLAGHRTGLNSITLSAEHDAVQDQLTSLIKPYAGVVELLHHWKKESIKVCLFTSGTRYMVERNFASAGIEGVDKLFDAMITADDEVARKPHPDTILELLRRVEVSPQHAMVVGDHVYDAMGGHQAQVRLTVGILHGFGEAPELISAGADVLVKDLFGLNTLLNATMDSRLTKTRRAEQA